ncbi:hypothetical protein SSOG_04226 [Streptomyces himastatinicus ATCC 53653]|uniref:Integral membrane protein n=1 Tax=Streptomyces himastatinicus ATCC 53653 TaxID=457427 RepID=D9WW03_9ACTN|nr:hypothetical protein [Streptomyces himastatinicus]EFL24512.1 hypothetical protein SSOG_04226 [Streptomyces himastatinicus ATCC 53653]
MPYALALGLTLLVEVPLYSAALPALGRVRPGRALIAAVLVNCLTHPVLWWFLTSGFPSAARATGTTSAAYPVALSLSEGVVWLAEALLLRYGLRLRGPLPYAVALTANAASLLLGLLLTG